MRPKAQLPSPTRRAFALTHLDKVLYPEQGLRKAELAAYVLAVADVMLPQVAGRPLTLVRCPEGRHKHCFFQKHVKRGMPDVIRPVRIPGRSGASEIYMTVDSVEGLLALVQLGVLELHTWVCHEDRLDRPDQLVVDLDPDEALPFQAVVEGAFEVKQRLYDVGLESFVKTTGGKGLHVVAPVTRHLDWDAHKAFARALVQSLATARPDRYVVNQRKSMRTGRIFLDYLRNGEGATAIAPYSPRAREGAPVATPVGWEEVAKIEPRALSINTVAARLQRGRDPWGHYASVRQSISAGARRTLGV